MVCVTSNTACWQRSARACGPERALLMAVSSPPGMQGIDGLPGFEVAGGGRCWESLTANAAGKVIAVAMKAHTPAQRAPRLPMDMIAPQAPVACERQRWRERRL